MSAAKPTPGPLVVRRRDHGALVETQNGFDIAWFNTGYGNGRSITAAEAYANARLFVAAGKLLEAAQEMLAYYRALIIGDDPIPTSDHPLHALAAAITEATGDKS